MISDRTVSTSSGRFGSRQRSTQPAGGRRLGAADGKTLKLAGILHLTGSTNITAALRHHAQRPHRPLQTLKTR
jgi:hypothetical protein